MTVKIYVEKAIRRRHCQNCGQQIQSGDKCLYIARRQGGSMCKECIQNFNSDLKRRK